MNLSPEQLAAVETMCVEVERVALRLRVAVDTIREAQAMLNPQATPIPSIPYQGEPLSQAFRAMGTAAPPEPVTTPTPGHIRSARDVQWTAEELAHREEMKRRREEAEAEADSMDEELAS